MEPSLTYLDHAATTPVRAEVREAMLPYLDDVFGNPSSAHRFGRAARAGLEQARREIAEAVGCEPTQVVFTSGGTEADNLAIIGAALAASARGRPRCVAVSAIEHKAILAAAHAVATLGGRGDRPAGRRRRIAAARGARRCARPQPRGRLGDVGQQRGRHRPADGGDRRALSRRGRAAPHRRRPGVRQGAGRPSASFPSPSSPFPATRSARPRASARWSCATARLVEAIIHGGGQQYGIRPGTENVAGAVALGLRGAVSPRRSRPPRRRGWPRCATSSQALLLRDVPDLVVHGRRRPPRAAHPDRRRRRRRQRDAADAPRPAGRGRVRRLGLLHRRGGAVARARAPWACRATSPSGSSASRSGTRAPWRTWSALPRSFPGRRRGRASWRGPSAVPDAGRVLVAMSGGVDSSVAAARLVEQGYDVVGATMKLFCYGDAVPDRPCCSLDSINDARDVAHGLGIPHYVLNLEDRFSPARHPELRERVQPRAHADSLRALQLVHQVPRPAGPRRRARLRLHRDRPLRRRARRRALPRAATAPRTRATSSGASTRRSWRACSRRWASSPRRRPARTPGASAWPPPTSRSRSRSASSPTTTTSACSSSTSRPTPRR